MSFSVPELTTDFNHCESDDFSFAFTNNEKKDNFDKECRTRSMDKHCVVVSWVQCLLWLNSPNEDYLTKLKWSQNFKLLEPYPVAVS